MLRQITINPTANGFVVQIGCQTLAYTDRDKLVRDLRDYLENPDETEKRIVGTECFNIPHTAQQGDECARRVRDQIPNGMSPVNEAGQTKRGF